MTACLDNQQEVKQPGIANVSILLPFSEHMILLLWLPTASVVGHLKYMTMTYLGGKRI